MAVEEISTIGPGKNYASVAIWNAAKQGNLPTADKIASAECYSFQDTTAVTISGWVTDPTRYIKIYTPVSERHPGYWDATKYRLEVVSGVALTVREENFKMEGLQITSGDNISIDIGAFSANAEKHEISSNIIKGNNTRTFSGILRFQGIGPNSESRVWNNVFFDGTATGLSGILISDSDLTIWIFNNTIKDCSRGITLTSVGQEYIKNNIIDCPDAFNGTFTNNDAFNDYNSSSQNLNDAALGSHGRFNQSFTYVNPGIDDFHLDPGDSGAVGFGVDLSSDPNLPVITDIDGEDTTALPSWNMGADQFGVVPPVALDLFDSQIETTQPDRQLRTTQANRQIEITQPDRQIKVIR